MSYDKTIIYKLCCNDTTITDIYVGHTISFVGRKSHHKGSCNNETDKSYNNYVYRFIRENGGWINWNMVELITVSCKDRKEALIYERKYILEYNATLNSIRSVRFHTEKKEYHKEYMATSTYNNIENICYSKSYYIEHKQNCIETQKKYNLEHKDKIKEYKRNYYQINKEKCKEAVKLYKQRIKSK